jgi:hypothetical protein
MDEAAEISAAAGRYKTTLELSLGAAERGKFEGPTARADAPATSLSQILVLRP